MADEEVKKTSEILPADVNGDGYVDDEEKRMYMEFKRKELEDQDAMRDSQRKMELVCTWRHVVISFCCGCCLTRDLDNAQKTLGDMPPTYFVAVAGIVGLLWASGIHEEMIYFDLNTRLHPTQARGITQSGTFFLGSPNAWR